VRPPSTATRQRAPRKSLSRAARDVVPKHTRQVTEQRGARCTDVHDEKFHVSPHSVRQERSSLGALDTEGSPRGRYHANEVRGSTPYPFRGVST
jgi:hypothetical protein